MYHWICRTTQACFYFPSQNLLTRLLLLVVLRVDIIPLSNFKLFYSLLPVLLPAPRSDSIVLCHLQKRSLSVIEQLQTSLLKSSVAYCVFYYMKWCLISLLDWLEVSYTEFLHAHICVLLCVPQSIRLLKQLISKM